MWLKKEGFKTLIDEWLKSFESRGTGSYVLTEKLKALKGNLRTWNKNSFGKVEEQKKEALKKVKGYDDLEVVRPLSEREREG